jgi:Helix-turn-helix domain
MSIQAMAWAIEQNPHDCEAKLLLICIANYADKNGKCWPSIETLVADSSLSRSTVRRRLDALETAGLIRREKRKSVDGGDASNCCFLPIRGLNPQVQPEPPPPTPMPLSGASPMVDSEHAEEPSLEPKNLYIRPTADNLLSREKEKNDNLEYSAADITSPDGRVRISAIEIEQLAKDCTSVSDVRALVRNGLRHFGEGKALSPAEVRGAVFNYIHKQNVNAGIKERDLAARRQLAADKLTKPKGDGVWRTVADGII